MSILCELGLKYNTDKSPLLIKDYQGHNYTPFYHFLFQERKNVVKTVLEIGIKEGGSLRMWAEYFSTANVWGIDNEPRYLFSEDRIHSVLADQSNRYSLLHARDTIGSTLDVIIDDGSHEPHDQFLSAETLIPFLSPFGIYIVEDVFNGVRVLLLQELIALLPVNQYAISLVERRGNSSDTEGRLIVIEKLE
jgi:hypothetical protein